MLRKNFLRIAISLFSLLLVSEGWAVITFPPRNILHPFITVSGGAAFTSDAGADNNFPATNTVFSFFNYQANTATQTAGMAGILIGEEFLASPEWSIQGGLGYYQTTIWHAKGVVTQGVDVATQNQYHYKYDIQPHQLLAEGKLLYNSEHRYHPYFSAGLGASWNRASQYSVNVQPLYTTFSNNFANKTTSDFSYMLGLGIDIDVTSHARLGIGYRFTDFGKVKTGSASIDNITMPYSLSQSHFYVNTLLAQLTYEFV